MDWSLAMESGQHMDKWATALALVGLATNGRINGVDSSETEESIVAPLTVKLILTIAVVGWIAVGLIGGLFTNNILSEIRKISESQASAAAMIAKDTAKIDIVIEDQKAQWICIHELQKPQNGSGK